MRGRGGGGRGEGDKIKLRLNVRAFSRWTYEFLDSAIPRSGRNRKNKASPSLDSISTISHPSRFSFNLSLSFPPPSLSLSLSLSLSFYVSVSIRASVFKCRRSAGVSEGSKDRNPRGSGEIGETVWHSTGLEPSDPNPRGAPRRTLCRDRIIRHVPVQYSSNFRSFRCCTNGTARYRVQRTIDRQPDWSVDNISRVSV